MLPLRRTQAAIKRCGDEIRLIEDQASTPARRILPEVIARFFNNVSSALRGTDLGLRKDHVRLLIGKVILDQRVDHSGSKRGSNMPSEPEGIQR